MSEKQRKSYRKDVSILGLPAARKLLPEEILQSGLNNQELRFVAAYCTNGFRVTDAYIKAGYAKGKRKNEAGSNGSSLLNRPHIQAAVSTFIRLILEPYQERLEYLIIDALSKRAFFDIAAFINADGTAKEIQDIPIEDRVVIDGMIKRVYGSGENRIQWNEMQLADRGSALRTLLSISNIGKGTSAGNQDTEEPVTTPTLPDGRQSEIEAIFKKNFGKNYSVAFGMKGKVKHG